MKNQLTDKKEAKYPTPNIYVGVFEAESDLFKEKVGLFKRPSHDAYYTGFIKTSEGFINLVSGEVCPIFEKYPDTYQKGDFGHSLEPIAWHMDPANMPSVMTEKEIVHVAATSYRDRQAKYPISNIYVGVFEAKSDLFKQKVGLFKRPSHDAYYTGFIKTSEGFINLVSGEVCPIFEKYPDTYQKGDFGHSLEPIAWHMDSANMPFVMTEKEIVHVAATSYRDKIRETSESNSLQKCKRKCLTSQGRKDI